MRTMKLYVAITIILTMSINQLMADDKIKTKKVSVKDIINMPANSWLAIPDTKMKLVTPSRKERPEIMGMAGPQGVITAWNSGILDTKRNRLVVWGGGHNDYYGNELYAFDIPTLKWIRLTEPSPIEKDHKKRPAFTLDNKPASRHTYNSLAYIPHADKFFAHGGVLAGIGYNAYGPVNITWTFDFTSNTWKNMKPSGEIAGGSSESFCAYDPITKKIWYQDGNFSKSRVWGLYSYDYDNNKWSKHNTTPMGRQSCEIEPKKHLMIGVGDKHVSIWDIGKQNFKREEMKTTGGEYIVKQRDPGVAFDPVTGQLVCWHGGSVYTLDLEKKSWTEHKATGAPTPAKWGTFGRWRYVPYLNAFIVVNSIHKNVYFYKLTAGGQPVNDKTKTVKKQNNK